jgi:hypothetical protein
MMERLGKAEGAPGLTSSADGRLPSVGVGNSVVVVQRNPLENRVLPSVDRGSSGEEQIKVRLV